MDARADTDFSTQPVSIGLRPCKHGLMMFFPHDVYIGGSLAAYGEYCELEVQFLLKMIQPNDIVIDAGAHIGCLTLPLIKRVGVHGRVLAFEPQRVMYQMLCGNMMLNGFMNAVLFRAAVGNPRTPHDLVGMSDTNYEEPNNFGDVRVVESAADMVSLTSIDQLHLPHCRLIKADVQGMELDVLKGAHQTIRKHRPFLYMEDDTGIGELAAGMRELNYDTYWHRPRLFNPDNHDRNTFDIWSKPYVACNVLGVPREMRQNVNVQLEAIT